MYEVGFLNGLRSSEFITNAVLLGEVMTGGTK